MRKHRFTAAILLTAALTAIYAVPLFAQDVTQDQAALPSPLSMSQASFQPAQPAEDAASPAPQDQTADAADTEPADEEPPYDLDWQNETDPFRRCAKKALAGLYGPLAFWQRDAYKWGLRNGVTCAGAAKVTSYGPWEGCGTRTSSGSRVHVRGCSANPELPFGALVWTPYGLRYVFDRGGWVKLGYVRGVGRVTSHREVANLDYYTREPWPTLRNAPFALVKETGDRTVWLAKRGG